MKKLEFSLMVLTVMSFLISCDEKDVAIPETNDPGIVIQDLSDQELVLKEQLAEAAKIIVEIAEDENVLDEIVASIKSQPQVMEDRVKFKDLMAFDNNSEAKMTGKGYFSKAFMSKLDDPGLKGIRLPG